MRISFERIKDLNKVFFLIRLFIYKSISVKVITGKFTDFFRVFVAFA